MLSQRGNKLCGWICLLPGIVLVLLLVGQCALHWIRTGEVMRNALFDTPTINEVGDLYQVNINR